MMITNQFDPYVIETWMDHGVVVAVPESLRAKEKERRGAVLERAFSVRSVLKASVVVVGMTLSSLQFATSGGVADALKVTQPLDRYTSEADEVPPGRWEKLVALLQSTEELPADDTSGDPAPLG